MDERDAQDDSDHRPDIGLGLRHQLNLGATLIAYSAATGLVVGLLAKSWWAGAIGSWVTILVLCARAYHIGWRRAPLYVLFVVAIVIISWAIAAGLIYASER